MFPLDATEKEIVLVLKSCEAYGRFALHKEASKDGPPRFSLQARTLLDWTTDRVIPVLCKQESGEATPFGGLNISRISATSASPAQPASPTPMPPSSKRTNRNTTPVRDGSFGSVEGDIDISPKADSTALLAHGVAVSLLQSSCLIFSDWLEVGGSGSDVIAASARSWCKIFSLSKDKAALQCELLPSFTRLMIQLCKTSDFSVLEEIIASCNKLDSEEDGANITDKTISNLLKGRDANGTALTGGIVDAVLGAALSLVRNKDDNLDEEEKAMPRTLSELWDLEEGSVLSALSAVLSNKQASIVLARKLAARFESGVDADNSSPLAMFQAKLLSLLFDKTSGLAEMDAVRSTLAAEKFAGDTAVSEVLRNLAKGLNA